MWEKIKTKCKVACKAVTDTIRNTGAAVAGAIGAAVAAPEVCRADFATDVQAVTLNMGPTEAAGLTVIGAVAVIWVIKVVIGMFSRRG